MHVISAGSLSARIKWLIETYDAGDREAAGRRLGIARDRLDGLLSGDWRRFSLEALARLVQGYRVSIDDLFALPKTEDPPCPLPRRFRPTSSSSTLPNSPGGS
jgi:hypothetical protein